MSIFNGKGISPAKLESDICKQSKMGDAIGNLIGLETCGKAQMSITGLTSGSLPALQAQLISVVQRHGAQ